MKSESRLKQHRAWNIKDKVTSLGKIFMCIWWHLYFSDNWKCYWGKDKGENEEAL